MDSLRPGGRRGACTAAATACAATGFLVLATALTGPQPPPAAPEAARSAPVAPQRGPAPRASALPRSEATAISIPEIGLRTRVEEVGRADDGSVAMPGDADHAGWYTGSAAPGENGNTVVVGHLDSVDGPAAFHGLGALEPGDRIRVKRRDGRSAVFTVEKMAVRPKDDFPSRSVYAPTEGPRLTLLTCADWDADARTYRSNLIVVAHPR